MTARATMPSGTPDPFIAAYADSARIAAKQVLRWKVDHIRLDLGWVEVIDPDTHDGSYRFLPCNRACAPYSHGHMVSDVLRPETTETLDWADLRLASIREQYQAGRMTRRMAALAMILTVQTAAEKIEQVQP